LRELRRPRASILIERFATSGVALPRQAGDAWVLGGKKFKSGEANAKRSREAAGNGAELMVSPEYGAMEYGNHGICGCNR